MGNLTSTMGLLGKSFLLDADFLLIKRLTFFERLSFLFKKYFTLVLLTFRRNYTIKLRNLRFTPHSLSSLGTLQSSIIDFYNDIVSTNIITGSNPVIVDIGANVGQFCTAAKLFYPHSKIYSFEPDPDVFQELVANTSHFKNVKLFNMGLGSKNENRNFYIHQLSLMSSFKKYDDEDYTEDSIVPLEVRKLDAVLSGLKKIDLIKVDVEGFEQEVISGAKKALSIANYLLIEISLSRSVTAGNNLMLLSSIHNINRSAKIIKFGRPLGSKMLPTCQDSLISLQG